MSTNATPVGSVDESPEVMASVERVGGEARLVIADISRDDAWVSADSGSTPDLEAWR
ncbi:MAG: hypothetical protein ABEJ58_00725 [Halodesulfurarchaeum sp.]